MHSYAAAVACVVSRQSSTLTDISVRDCVSLEVLFQAHLAASLIVFIRFIICGFLTLATCTLIGQSYLLGEYDGLLLTNQSASSQS